MRGVTAMTPIEITANHTVLMLGEINRSERPSAVPKSVTNVAAMMILPISVLVSPVSTSTA